jgi:hypothetical protein
MKKYDYVLRNHIERVILYMITQYYIRIAREGAKGMRVSLTMDEISFDFRDPNSPVAVLKRAYDQGKDEAVFAATKMDAYRIGFTAALSALQRFNISLPQAN